MQYERVASGQESLALIASEGAETVLPYLWLRDNCQCEECRVGQTSEKRFHLVDVSPDVAPAAASLQDGELRLTWPDGHESCYSVPFITSLVGKQPHVWQRWPDRFVPQAFDFTDFLESDAQAAAAITGYLETGVLLLQNAPVEPGTLELLAPRLGPIREVLFERIHNVEVDPKGYNVAHTALPLPPHNDFASYTWPPSVQALHMLANETEGGESVLVDGWEVLHGLRIDHPDYFAQLCTTPVPFREFDDSNETYTQMPLVRCDVHGEIVGLRYSNQLMQPMDPTGPDVCDFYRAYHELSRRIMSGEARTSFRLEGGQILVVQAHRVLHGRGAFTPNARRHLQDAYYEHDNVSNHLVVLQRRMSYE
jgi:alpha-ketoglutarate-dependent taurine dioxygenase/DUF971 family protein